MKPNRQGPTITLFVVITAIAVAFVARRSGDRPDKIDKAEAPSEVSTGTVAAGPFLLSYAVEGEGHPTIVVGSTRYYQRVFSADLRKHLQLVFMDHRGFAPSPGAVDTTAFALDTLIDDMERVRQQLRLERVAVMGHSGHSYMALEYAKKYPAHVSHVIMIGIAPDMSAASTESLERHWRDHASAERKTIMEEKMRALSDAAIAQLPLTPGQKWVKTYVRNGPRAWYDPQFDASALFEGVDVNMDMLAHVWGRIFRDIDITRGLQNLEQPVFIALGREDYLVAPASHWDPVVPLFRDVTVKIFERSGHTPQYEEAALFDAELLRWLQSR